MDEESLVTDSAYVQRLVWQQMNGPKYVLVSNKAGENQDEIGKEADATVNDENVMDVEEDCGNRKSPRNSFSCRENLKSNNGGPGNHSMAEQQKKRFNGRFERSVLEKENDYRCSTLIQECLSTSLSVCNSPMAKNQPSRNVGNGKNSSVPDRYIPRRDFDDWRMKFSMAPEVAIGDNHLSRKKENIVNEMKDSATYNNLLQNEILDCDIENTNRNGKASSGGVFVANFACGSPAKCQLEENRTIPVMADPVLCSRNLFHYKRKADLATESVESSSPYSLSPVGIKSQRLLRSPRKATRKISRVPFKVLDAPELQDDFYLNLVDWSSQNVLAVGLGNSVYLWSASTSQVTRLCDFLTDNNTVTSVSWNERGNYVAIGTHHGYVQIWDVVASKLITKLSGHTARVGALAWNGEMLTSGSRDRMIFQRDIRSNPNLPDRRLVGHRQEVCGLKWSSDNLYLASGGNDNRLYVWNLNATAPLQTYSEHLAAVKAIAWSPHQHGLLASGGGTADRCIRFWNTLTGQPMQCIDTGSQVCNLAWSKHSSELVSTHGYSQNQIFVWKYPSLTQVAKLTGHSYRVLYLAMSPDGESIVTGAGDETLRFWNVFSKTRSQKERRGYLNLMSQMR